jgi:signal transduction histidine kinase
LEIAGSPAAPERRALYTAGVTTSPADAVPARPLQTGTRLGSSLALAEVGLSLADIVLVSAPAVALAGQALQASRELLRLLPLLAALLFVAWVRAADSLRPVTTARDAKQSGQPLSEAQVAAASRAVARAPVETALVRWAIWTAASVYVALRLATHASQSLPWASAAGVACIGFLHAGGVAAARALVWERVLSRARRTVLPNFDPLRAFAGSYRRTLSQTAGALLVVGHAVNAALVAVFTELTSRQAGTLLAVTVPALAVPMVFWYASLRRRTLPIERYFDAAVRRPGLRGPNRDDPGAVAAFQAAQSLPYRLAGYQTIASAFAAVAIVLVGRRLSGFDGATAGRLLGAMGLVILAMGLYETLLLRDVLRPLLAQLGSRHRLPVAEIGSSVSLRTKLIVFFGSVTIFVSGLVLLFALSPARGLGVMVGSVALGLGLALGLVFLIVRDLVTPIRALEERSEEMARGELARPVAPWGEADEIGRLTFVFEEMRRALRDKLRSTESLNIDLEREVRRRTEVLEQRNGELRDALEKLRRAQDDLIRTEKLASMGRLVAGIAHEINNPVNAVINTLGPLQEALREMADATDPAALAAHAAEAQEMLSVMQRGAARSKAIVQALHNYSRGDEETPRELVLARSIDDTLDLLRHRLKNIRVEKQIDPGIRLTGFAGQIDQVFMNLITNAAQAVGERPRGGTIHLAASRSAGEVEVTVADDGPGIPPEVIPRIFDPFFTTKDVGEGSGLGLSIVHGIVERHGGNIQVQSRLGEGTTFRVTLPLRPVPGKAPVPASRDDDKLSRPS